MYTVKKTDHFETWLVQLRDSRAVAKILARIKRAELGNLGDHKGVGNGISEMRIEYGPGYRVYFKRSKGIIIILLIGGDKSSQKKDIQRAYDISLEIGLIRLLCGYPPRVVVRGA